MNVLGTGLVCARGRGKEAVLGEWIPPEFIEVPFQDNPFPVYAVSRETLKDRTVLGKMRRADRFSKMATLAANDAVADSGVEFNRPERVGAILATAFGPHNTTFKFLDDIIDYGDTGVSPTIFSNSIHNVAISYISQTLNLKGPTWTVTHFHTPFEESVALARAWLDEGRCDYVLLGGGDECGSVMEYIFSQKIPVAYDGKLGNGKYIPAEGMAFFLLSNSTDGQEFRVTKNDHSFMFGNMATASALNCAFEILKTKASSNE